MTLLTALVLENVYKIKTSMRESNIHVVSKKSTVSFYPHFRFKKMVLIFIVVLFKLKLYLNVIVSIDVYSQQQYPNSLQIGKLIELHSVSKLQIKPVDL